MRAPAKAIEVRACRDVSFPGAVRKCIDVQALRPLSNEEIVGHAMLAIKWAARWGQAQAYSVGFWLDASKIAREKADAIVEYAPHGVWADADKAKLGDYSLHLCKIIHGMETKSADPEQPKGTAKASSA